MTVLRRAITIFDPSTLLLIATVALATLLQPRGALVRPLGIATNAGIALLSFLHGAKLSRKAIVDGARNWRLHAATLAVTFLLFPLMGLGLTGARLIEGPLASGMLFPCLLPSTVQSSVAFTSIARGNVTAAVCSASFSNLAGIFITPALVALLIGGRAGGPGGSPAAGKAIVLQLLLPFVAGHLLQPVIGTYVVRHKALVTMVDGGSILLVVYTALGAAVVGGLWSTVPPAELLKVLMLAAVVLALVMAAATLLGRFLRLAREDRVVLLFCGSKKSLASGVPMASVLFAPGKVGMIVLPLIVFHQWQLIVCAVIARRLAARAGREAATGIASAQSQAVSASAASAIS